MARIVFGGYMVRYPMAGMLSNTIEYLVALKRLGHEVAFVERSGYSGSCWDPSRNTMSDDPTYGLEVVGELMGRFGIGEWCYLDAAGSLHGPAADRCGGLFRSADVYMDYGAHGTWADEAAGVPVTVLIDGEPGFNQIKFERRLVAGETPSVYDHYFTNGRNVGTSASPSPTAGLAWKHLFHPVNSAIHEVRPLPVEPSFTTVMNWQSHDRIEHHGVVYGQKDVEFEHFAGLPRLVPPGVSLDLAVGGPAVPVAELRELGWHVLSGHDVTSTYDRLLTFIDNSTAEFSVCKNVFVALHTGWFSDRSAVYLARGRPVIMQDTGFSAHLPIGEGLFAVRTLDEAAAAVEAVLARPALHSRRAREVAVEHLEGVAIMKSVLDAIGVA